MKQKVCKECGKLLPLDSFRKSNLCKDGYTNVCKECIAQKRRDKSGVKLELLQIDGTIVCPDCGRELHIDMFDKTANSKTGRRWLCRDCYKKHQKINQGQDKNYFKKLRLKLCPDFKDKIRKQKKKSRERNFEQEILRQCKSRAERKGLEFNLNLSDIVIPDKCPLLEVPFNFGNKKNYEYTPSIDRIDNSKGYIKGNVQIISMKANAMKNSASPEELYTFCKNILRYSPSYTESEGIELENKESQG